MNLKPNQPPNQDEGQSRAATLNPSAIKRSAGKSGEIPSPKIVTPQPAPQRASPFLKAMYYWVHSRF